MDMKNDNVFEQLAQCCVPWYLDHARILPWRQDRDPYHIWVSEIMLQQTRVEAVKRYYTRFLEAFPDVFALANAPEDRLMKLWEGLGYYSRARNLQKCARIIVELYGGTFPKTYDELIKLPGIGAYTAGAISSICYDMPTPAVDGNVLRVVARILELDEEIDLPAVKKDITEALRAVYPVGHCGDFSQGLMELGATVCLPDGMPKCTECPAQGICKANQNGTQLEFPKRIAKKKRTVEEKTVFILTCDGKKAVCKREETGLLAGLWQFPNVSGIKSEEDAIKQVEAWGAKPIDLERSVHKKHIFTHIEWHMRGIYISCRDMPKQFFWADADDFSREIALPTAFRKFL